MRKLFSLAIIGGLVWWFLSRRLPVVESGATIGYADGSSVTLGPGSPHLARLLQIAGEARTA